jgi:hypothetical protein
LVGIAGEDDLDAPDLDAPSQKDRGPERQLPNPPTRPNGGRNHFGRKAPNDHDPKEEVGSANPLLKRQLSAVLRDQLVSELRGVNSVDDAAIWARRILPAKNSLNASDAQQLEHAFQARLAEFEIGCDTAAPRSSRLKSIRTHATSVYRKGPETTRKSISETIQKKALAHPEPRRIRDREHVKFVAGQSCLICGRQPADPHHLRFAQSRALGRKVSDEFTVPLCRGHHREVHRYGDEATWWRNSGVDPTLTARALWLESHPLKTAPGKG